MTANEKDGVPERSREDVALTIAKAGLSAIPVVGGPVAELFGLVVTPALDRRREEWMHSVAGRLEELEGRVKGFRIEDLPKNEAFISTLTHASQAAIRTHQQEKLEALRNAVANVAIGSSPDENVQLMFVNLVDRLTPLHLRILRFFENPRPPEQHGTYPTRMHMIGSPARVLEEGIPGLKGKQELYELVVRDLHSAGLFSVSSLGGTVTGQGMYESRTTKLGDEFLRFITSPSEP
ncbi:MAG: hypothetical protein WBD59_03425 [Candidatus Sulfotelmatobacter sp.]